MAGRVRFRIGDSEVEVEGDPKFVDKYLNKFLERIGVLFREGPTFYGGGSAKVDLPSQIATAAKSKKAPSPAEFYLAKKPDSGTETLVVFAKYLEDFRSQPEFKLTDINKIAKEAKTKDIHSQYLTYAVKQGLVRPVGKGKYGLTLSGESAVAAMPTKALDAKP